MSSVITEGEDRNGLKLEKVSQFFHVLKQRLEIIAEKLLWFALSVFFSFDIFFVILQEHFVYGREKVLSNNFNFIYTLDNLTSNWERISVCCKVGNLKILDNSIQGFPLLRKW